MRVAVRCLVSVGMLALAGLWAHLSRGDPGTTQAVGSAAHDGGADGGASSPCPSDMVLVAGKFCIDRYEASVSDGGGRTLSPYYPPDPLSAQRHWRRWTAVLSWEERAAAGRLDAGADAAHLFAERQDAASCLGGKIDPDSGTCWQPRALVAVPPLPPWQRSGTYEYRAVSRPDVIPQGYMSGVTAEHACRAAGKRLCTEVEWVTACRGESRTRHPYGDKYRPGVCNIHREAHPSVVLRGDWGAKLTDPRMNLMHSDGDPLLRPTGQSPACVSRWGDDVIYDMVGNLDEWVDHRAGLFLGGFYARATRRGCLARIWTHAVSHVDFSTGFRCCRDTALHGAQSVFVSPCRCSSEDVHRGDRPIVASRDRRLPRRNRRRARQ